MNRSAIHPHTETLRPQSTAPKPSFVTNVTLHWYPAGIQFPAAEAPRVWSGHSCPLGLVPNGQIASIHSPLEPLTPRDYSLRPRALAGSCITGVAVCI
jgi:hypothetical protein